MTEKAFQDYYPDHLATCYGCGHQNPRGLQIKSFWDGDESVCRFRPRPHHTAIAGYVYGGLLASLIDCHATGTAAAAAYRAQGRAMDTAPVLRYVTGTLNVKFLKPTPIDAELLLRGRVTALEARKATIEVELSARGQVCVTGEAVCLQVPEDWLTASAPRAAGAPA